MTNLELKQLRKLLCLTSAEAAEHVSQTTKRTWERYESGDLGIPLDVEQAMQMLALTRFEQVQYVQTSTPFGQHLETLAEFTEATGSSSVLKWRLAQSISADRVAYEQAMIAQQEETINA